MDMEIHEPPLPPPSASPPAPNPDAQKIIDDLRLRNPYWWNPVVSSFITHHGLNGQQIESFNLFLDDLPHIIDSLPEIIVEQEQEGPKKQKVTHTFKFLGKSLTFSPPKQIELNCFENTKLYPNEARLRNGDYQSEMNVKLEWTQKIVTGAGGADRINVESVPIHLGWLPVMVGSKICHLDTRTTEEQVYFAKNECPLDPGGYFILNGKEKVIVGQERIAENFVHVFKKQQPTDPYQAEIRSSLDDRPGQSKMLWVYLESASKSNSSSSYSGLTGPEFRALKVKIPELRESVNISLIFQALGILKPAQALEMILGIAQNQAQREELEKLLVPTFQIWKVDPDRNIKFDLGLCSKSSKLNQPQLDHTDSDRPRPFDDTEIAQIIEKGDQIVDKLILPHIGAQNLLQKAFYLSFMVWKLLMVEAGLMEPDDRDHLKNKIVVNCGPLLTQIMYTSLHKFRIDIKKKLEIAGASKKIGFGTRGCSRKSKDFNLSGFLNYSSITNDLKYRISTGIWGDKREIGGVVDRVYCGITQDLNRYNQLAHLALLRRVSSAEDKFSHSVAPRQLHSSHFGYYCCNETPEGKSIGLVKHLALMARISGQELGLGPSGRNLGCPKIAENSDFRGVSRHPKDPTFRPLLGPRIVEFISTRESELDFVPLPSTSTLTDFLHNNENKHRTQIHIGGLWIGSTLKPQLLVNSLKTARQNGKFPPEVSISWTPQYGLINVVYGAGRLVRPLFVVTDGNRLNFTAEYLEKLVKSDRSYGWKNLISDGLIELVDPRESETSTLIGFLPENLLGQLKNGKRIKFTHMEIHPSAQLLGLSSLTTPFSNHNPSPRNMYQAQIAKQSMGLPFTNLHARMDATTHLLHYPQKPIVSSQGLDLTQINQLPSGGANCVLAFMSEAYNQEDAYIINRSSLERGLFRGSIFHSWKNQGEKRGGGKIPDDEITKPNHETVKSMRHFDAYKNLESDGLPAPGMFYESDGDYEKAIIGKIVGIETSKVNDATVPNGIIKPPQSYIDASTFCSRFGTPIIDSIYNSPFKLQEKQPKPIEKANHKKHAIPEILTPNQYRAVGGSGIVDKVMISQNKDGNRIAGVKIRQPYFPQIGDKLGSVHGQKGVIGMVYSQEDLPFTKDGLVPDILINPHSIPSRMTIGQFYEMLLGKAIVINSGKRSKIFQDGTPFEPRDLDQIGRILSSNDFHGYGNETMYDPFSGRKIKAQIFIGPSYIQALKHIMENKIHVRARGRVDQFTRQPVGGAGIGGGIRIGEMERDCLITHGGAQFLHERLNTCSDSFNFPICSDCGQIGAYSTIPTAELPVPSAKLPVSVPQSNRTNIYYCTSCSLDPSLQNLKPLTTIQMPYAAKLLFQELMSMNIRVQILP